VTRETWIDANVFAVPRLVDEPDCDTDKLAQEWIASSFGPVSEALGAAILDTLRHSPWFVLRGFYMGPYARGRADAWHPNADWIQDDMLDAQAAWRIIEKLPDAALDELVQEKQQAVDQVVKDQEALTRASDADNRHQVEPLVNSMMYAESLFMTLRDLLAGMAAYRRYLKSREPALAAQCRHHLIAAQNHWTQHTQRHGSQVGGATAFRENQFWELTQKFLTDLG
jgi:hypothetical protein